MSPTSTEAAYQEGWAAFMRKLRVGENPYFTNTPEHSEWLRGWYAAQASLMNLS